MKDIFLQAFRKIKGDVYGNQRCKNEETEKREKKNEVQPGGNEELNLLIYQCRRQPIYTNIPTDE